MSQIEPELTTTQHAMLVVWGQYAQQLGIIQRVQAITVHQKTRTHSPQTKVLAFLVALLAGLPHLKDISHAAHPLDQDEAVARAWQQPAWADYSGVSRTLQALTQAEVDQVVGVLDTASQPFIDQEVMLAIKDQGGLVYDGDLTGRPVSNTSTTYPNVAYGHMSDGLHLGYQAALVSLHSPSYGRLWLSVQSHAGDTVSCTQANALAQAAEGKTGVRPRRRTELLRERLQTAEAELQQAQSQLDQARTTLTETQARREQTQAQRQSWREKESLLAADDHAHERPERPHSQLAQARAKVDVYQRRQARQAKVIDQAERRVNRRQAHLRGVQAQHTLLQQRLAQFEQDNAANPSPIQAVFRLDAGFGTPDNVALLIEMGYDIYTKPYSHRVTTGLRRRVSPETSWTRVGANAEMIAWAAISLAKYPYPLDVALERFHTGETIRYSTLLHYGTDPVTTDLPTWFRQYNGRQTIEAGIKEGKQVFQMHHLKVRAKPALDLQEHFAVFAANFVRWAAHWLTTQCRHVATDDPILAHLGVKALIQVVAHTSAYVVRQDGHCSVRFSEHSLFAGQGLETW